MVALEEEGQWDALERWSGFVWLTRCPKIDTIPEDVERTTLSLFRHRPNAVRKLEQLLRRSGSSHVPESVFDRFANGRPRNCFATGHTVSFLFRHQIPTRIQKVSL